MSPSKNTTIASFAATMMMVLMITPVYADTVHHRTVNPHRNDVFDVYDATRAESLSDSQSVSTQTANPHRTEVFDAYEATRTAAPSDKREIKIKTTNAHRNDVFDLYKR